MPRYAFSGEALAPEVVRGRLRLDVDGHVAILTIEHPATRNALSMPMWRRLASAVRELDADPRTRAIVITGDGDHFSAGADLTDLPEDPAGFHALHLAAEAAIADSLTPVVAAIRGACVGGGCEIATAADVRFADPSARFGVTASRLGIVYPEVPTRRLTQLIGVAETRRLLLAGEILDVDWALRAGLVSEVVVGEDVLTRAVRFAQLVVRRSSTSVRAAQSLTRGLPPGPEDPADYVEGRRAFLAGREPRFDDPW